MPSRASVQVFEWITNQKALSKKKRCSQGYGSIGDFENTTRRFVRFHHQRLAGQEGQEKVCDLLELEGSLEESTWIGPNVCVPLQENQGSSSSLLHGT